MLTWWGRAVARIRWLIVAAAIAVVALAAGWGAGVLDDLASGGFDDPDSEALRAAERITAEFGGQDPDLLALYSSETATVDDPAFREPVTATLAAVRQRPEVASVVTWYDTGAPELVSQDRRATFAVVTLRAPDDDTRSHDVEVVEPELHAPGLTTEIGGQAAFFVAADEQAEADIMRGEMIALPVALVLLVFLFRGVVAAAMPLLVGVLAILGALTATKLLAGVTDVSSFALNIIILLGLGMAIDYSLLVVSRFREELRAGHAPWEAVARTIATAGRTVLVSGLIIALSLSSLLLFPQMFLRSMGFGGMAAVLVAMLGALTVLPALLGMLGRRIDRWRLPLPRWRRRSSGRAGHDPADRDPADRDPADRDPADRDPADRDPADRDPADRGAADRGTADHGGWARLALSVMRRPLLYLTAVLAALAVLAAPLLGVRFAGADERVLPADAEVRVVNERLADEFPGGGSPRPITVFVQGATPEQVDALVGRVRALPDVAGAEVTGREGDAALVEVTYPGDRTSDAAYGAVRAIRDLPAPEGVEVLVGGVSAIDLDRVDSIGERLPWMAVWMASVIMVVLFLAFGSVLLPVKAVLMNLVSIGAAFGVVVWVFQDGNLAGVLGFTATGQLEPSMPILLFAILFGLSTDYEVFLLGRVREAWDRTGDSTAAVAIGVQRSGRIITAAALVLSAVVAGFASGEVLFVKLLGVGMIVAIAVDATLVRLLLVPASMRLLGRWSWWIPGPLARLYRSFGIRETAAPAEEPDRPTRIGAGT